MAKLNNYRRGTGGGGPSPAPLLEIEERLMGLMGLEAAIGHSNIIDPAEPESWTDHFLPVINASQPTENPKSIQSSTVENLPTHSDSPSTSSFMYSSPIPFTPISTSSLPPFPSSHPHSTNLSFSQHSACSRSSQLTSSTSSFAHASLLSLTSTSTHSHTTDIQPILLSSSSEHPQSITTSSSTFSHFSPIPSSSKHNIQKVAHLPSPSKKYITKRLRKEKLTEVRDIDVEILKEMRAQTAAIEKLTRIIGHMASSIEHFINKKNMV